MSIDETAILCGIDSGDIEEGVYTSDYIRGKLEAELAVRRSLVMKAQDGDSAAQKEFLKIAEASRLGIE